MSELIYFQANIESLYILLISASLECLVYFSVELIIFSESTRKDYYASILEGK